MPAKLAQGQMVQKSRRQASTSTPRADSSFDGLDFATWGAGHPPDENGDVGPTYYIQTVNTSIGIYDKSNGNRVAAFTFNSFMSQGHFGNLCDTNNFGDPVVLYDSYENRWMITDFAFTLDGSGNVSPQTVFQCFAVSKTGDPVNGGWNYYSILDPGGLGDYPKFGIWPDGIYMSREHVRLRRGRRVHGLPRLGAEQAADVCGRSAGVRRRLRRRHERLHGHPGQLEARGRRAARGEPGVLRLDRALPQRACGLQVPGQLGQDLDLDLHRPVHRSRAELLAERDAGERIDARERRRRPPIRAMAAPQYTNQGGAESVWVAHTVSRGSRSRLQPAAAPPAATRPIRWYQANVTGGTIARTSRRARASTRRARTRSSASSLLSPSTASATWR